MSTTTVDVPRRPREPVLVGSVVAALTGLGLVMTFSASFVSSTAQDGDPFGVVARQAVWCAIGGVVLVAVARVDHRRWRRVAAPLAALTLVASIAVLVPGIGTEVNGARRWFDLGPVSIQPSEVAKLALPLYCAAAVAHRWDAVRRGDIRALLLPSVPMMGLLAFFVVLGPDLETAFLVAAGGVVVLWVAGLPLRVLGAVGGGLAAVGAAAVTAEPYRRARIAAWFDPAAYGDTFGYQTLQGFIALGSGGWGGVGLGQGRGKWLYVPNAHTDFIFAIIGEELGLAGALAVLALFALLAVAGVRTARRAPDPFGRLLAAGITGWLVLQAFVNVGSVVGLLPVTGVTLPLVSFGGSSLVITMAGAGILIAIARAGRSAGDEHPPTLRAVAGAGSRTAPHGPVGPDPDDDEDEEDRW